jgi:hypothetical protein
MNDPINNSQKQIKRVTSVISIEGLVTGFRHYLHTWRHVLLRRGQLATLANHDEAPININASISVYLYGVALTFTLYLPLILLHSLQLPKLYFLLQFIYIQLLNILLWHLSIKAVRGNGSMKETAGVVCTWIGILTPVVLLLFYPFLIYSPAVDFIHPASQSTPPPPPWVLIWTVIIFFILTILFLLLPLRWLATIHEIKGRRILVGSLLVFFPLMSVHEIFVAPFVSDAIVVLSDYLGELT